ncbi:MAG: type IX secretion system membrane protein PorP/SprF [Bacteroidales bacterium]
MKKNFFILFILFVGKVYSQDPQFSQYYSNYLYLAPSFTGLTENNRLSMNYRNQWPDIPNGFVTYAVSFDKYFEKFRSGLGLFVMQDEAGSGKLRLTNIGLSYSFDFKITNNWHIRPGMGFLYTERGINFNNLLWSDQISATGNSPATSELNPMDNIGDIDFSASVLGYSDIFWVGLTVDHLLQPNQSFYFYEDDEENPGLVPLKFSFYGGTKILKNESLLRPIPTSFQIAYLFKAQKQFRQLDIGVYWHRSPIVLGFWYRGIPLYKEVFNRDAFTILAGYKLKHLSIGYSYDFTMSKLITRTGGSHEVSLSYYFKTKKFKRKPKMLPCPDF